MKVNENGPSHMTKMAAKTIMVKMFRNLLQNWETRNLSLLNLIYFLNKKSKTELSSVVYWHALIFLYSEILLILLIFIPRHTKSSGVLCYTLRTLSVRPSISRLSVRANIWGLGASLSMIMRFIPLRIHWVALKPIFCLRFRGYFSMGV